MQKKFEKSNSVSESIQYIDLLRKINFLIK